MEKSRKFMAKAAVISNEPLISAVWKMVLLAPEISAIAKPGQFVGVLCPDGKTFLRRPFGIADADPAEGTITIIYRLVGKGTENLKTLEAGAVISVQGPLGNGFPIREGKGLLVGGGVGVAPLIFLAKRLESPVVLIGGKNADELFWEKLLKKYADSIYATTDDGSKGIKGFAVQALPKIFEENRIDYIATCGPTVMMESIAKAAKEAGIPCDVSMEKRMACGIGVCLGCTFEGKKSHKRFKVCADGPVFDGEEVFG